MKTNMKNYVGLSMVFLFISMQLWGAEAQNPTPSTNTTSIRYTMIAPASTTWTSKDFDDSAWTKTEDAASIPAAVQKDGEVWIRISCDLPWELINNTYAKVFGTGSVEVYVNGKQTDTKGGYPSNNGWRPWPLSPVRNDQPGVNVYAFHGKGAAGFQLVHEPWVMGSYPEIKPQALISEMLRDANIIRGGDGNYYMTGTFAGTEGDGLQFFGTKTWKNNDGVKLYRSPDLKHWTDIGWVWTFKNNATWCKEPFKSNDSLTNGRQAIFAPKFHYLNGKYIIVYGVNFSMPNHDWGIGIAVADKPEGPYRETSPDKPICPGYDSHIFRDDDGQLYLIRNNGLLGKLKADMSGLDGPMQLISPENYPFVGFEGVSMIKRGDMYYVMAADIFLRPGGGTMGSTMVASSKNIFGPYSKRYVLLNNGWGHARPFQDENGKWWTAMWNWEGLSQRFWITGIDFAADGTIYPTGEVIQPPQMYFTALLPTSQVTAQTWKSTTTQPGADWYVAAFNDNAWKSSQGGFGTGGMAKTTWNTPDIWLRKQFTVGALTSQAIDSLVFSIFHDENCEIYINGILATSLTGYNTSYVIQPFSTEGKNALKLNTQNVIAVHCHQTIGGQFIDVGISVSSYIPNSASTGLKTIYGDSKISVFPNPVKNTLSLSVGKTTRVKIFNANAQLVKECKVEPYQKSIDVAFLKQGIYFLRYNNGNNMCVSRFIKQ